MTVVDQSLADAVAHIPKKCPPLCECVHVLSFRLLCEASGSKISGRLCERKTSWPAGLRSAGINMKVVFRHMCVHTLDSNRSYSRTFGTIMCGINAVTCVG